MIRLFAALSLPDEVGLALQRRETGARRRHSGEQLRGGLRNSATPRIEPLPPAALERAQACSAAGAKRGPPPLGGAPLRIAGSVIDMTRLADRGGGAFKEKGRGFHRPLPNDSPGGP